jgi:hypothetical protein
VKASTKALIAGSAVAYLTGAFLTFGYAYNLPMTRTCGFVYPDICRDAPLIHGNVAVIAGFGWPVYWAGNLAIDATRPSHGREGTE